MSVKIPSKLYKTKIVIWSEYDPTTVELEDLARDAQTGESYCSKSSTVMVKRKDLPKDHDWDGTDFFGVQEGNRV